jgi:hypothetical protein
MDRGGVGTGAGGFIGRGDASAVAGAWPGHQRAGPILEPSCQAVSRAEALRVQLAEVTERLAEATARAGTLAEGLAVAVGSAWSARVVASQQRARAEGMFCLLCDFVLASFFSSSEVYCSAVFRVRDGS